MTKIVAKETIESALRQADVPFNTSDIDKLDAVLNNQQVVSSLTAVIVDEIDRKRSNKIMNTGKKAKSIIDL